MIARMRWLAVVLAACGSAGIRSAAAQAHLGRVKGIEQREQSELEIGRATRADLTEVRLARMQAELFVAQEKGPHRLGHLSGLPIERVKDKGGEEQATSRRIADLERRLSDLERKFEQKLGMPEVLEPSKTSGLLPGPLDPTPVKSSPR